MKGLILKRCKCSLQNPKLRPSVNVELFMYRTQYLQLSTGKDKIDVSRRIEWLTEEFRQYSDLVSNVELFMCRT